MLKKAPSFVLASLRASTYRKGYAFRPFSLRPRWMAFLNILRSYSDFVRDFPRPVFRQSGTGDTLRSRFILQQFPEFPDYGASPHGTLRTWTRRRSCLRLEPILSTARYPIYFTREVQ